MVYSLWLKPQGNFSHSQYMTFWYMGIFWIFKDYIFWFTPQIGGANTYPEFNIGPIPWYYFNSLENGPRSPIHQFVLYYFMNFYCYCQRCTEINQNDKKGETPLIPIIPWNTAIVENFIQVENKCSNNKRSEYLLTYHKHAYKLKVFALSRPGHAIER